MRVVAAAASTARRLARKRAAHRAQRAPTALSFFPGYRESVGVAHITAAFDSWCATQRVPRASLAADDATVNNFVSFLLDAADDPADDGIGNGGDLGVGEAWDDGFVDVEDDGEGDVDDDAPPAAPPPLASALVVHCIDSSSDDGAGVDTIESDSEDGGKGGGGKAPARARRSSAGGLPFAPPPPAPLRPPLPTDAAITAASAHATDADRAAHPVDLARARVFGLPSFRPPQRAVIDAALAGRDVFVLMPTGGGKSLCYQLPAVVSAGVTVVVSPLLSLVQDQVAALLAAPGGGVPAASLSSALPEAERRAVLAELRSGAPTLKLLYVTPEQLARSGALRAALTALHARGMLARLVVDEAHCVSAW